MPIYEFKCSNCSQVTEKWLKLSDPYPTECEHCHKGPLEKLMSATGFVLKGSGWYATDFKKKSSASSSDSSSSSCNSQPETCASPACPAKTDSPDK